MSVVKRIYKSTESKAIEYFDLGRNSSDLNEEGMAEFIQYMYETNAEAKKGFLEKIVEEFESETKKK